MTLEVSATSSTPNVAASKPARSPGGASDAAQGGASSFVSLLATSMEPDAEAAPDSSASGEDAPEDTVATPLPDTAALLAQSLGWTGKLSATDAAALAAAATSAASAQAPLGQITASDTAKPLAPAASALSALARPDGAIGGKPDTKLPDGKAAGGHAALESAPDAGQPLPEDIADLRRTRMLAAAAVGESSKNAAEAASQPSAKGAAARAHEGRLAAEAAALESRGAATSHSGSAAAVALSLTDGAAPAREAGNARNGERSAFRPLGASAGAAGAASPGSWASQQVADGNATGAMTYSPEVAAPTSPAAVAEKLHYWVSRGVQNAELQLDAFGGGSVKVNIAVQGNEAQVEFRTDQPEARKMLQDAMPQLKDMLKGEGLMLSGGFVGTSAQQDPGAQDRRPYPQQGTKAVMVNLEVASPGMVSAPGRAAGRALDVFV